MNELPSELAQGTATCLFRLLHCAPGVDLCTVAQSLEREAKHSRSM